MWSDWPGAYPARSSLLKKTADRHIFRNPERWHFKTLDTGDLPGQDVGRGWTQGLCGVFTAALKPKAVTAILTARRAGGSFRSPFPLLSPKMRAQSCPNTHPKLPSSQTEQEYRSGLINRGTSPHVHTFVCMHTHAEVENLSEGWHLGLMPSSLLSDTLSQVSLECQGTRTSQTS